MIIRASIEGEQFSCPKGRGAHEAPRPPRCPPGCRLRTRIKGPVGPEKAQPCAGSIVSATRSRPPRNSTRRQGQLRSLGGHADFAVSRAPDLGSTEAKFDATGSVSAGVSAPGRKRRQCRTRRPAEEPCVASGQNRDRVAVLDANYNAPAEWYVTLRHHSTLGAAAEQPRAARHLARRCRGRLRATIIALMLRHRHLGRSRARRRQTLTISLPGQRRICPGSV